MAHGSYRPPWRETKEDKKRRNLELRIEIREAIKTLRLCTNCNKFLRFKFLNADINYLYFICPKCSESIKVNRKINRNDDRNWC